jgi:response regulator RpfG family c-di-GMP phosphodiesterase
MMAFRNTLSVLLVDDSPYDRSLFREIIDSIDKTIHLVSLESGQAAIDYFNTSLYIIPHYVFLDVNMPGMDGIETLAALKKIEVLETIPFYMYSTGDPTHYKDSAKLLGAVDCIRKVIDFDESCRQIEAILFDGKKETELQEKQKLGFKRWNKKNPASEKQGRDLY